MCPHLTSESPTQEWNRSKNGSTSDFLPASHEPNQCSFHGNRISGLFGSRSPSADQMTNQQCRVPSHFCWDAFHPLSFSVFVFLLSVHYDMSTADQHKTVQTRKKNKKNNAKWRIVGWKKHKNVGFLFRLWQVEHSLDLRPHMLASQRERDEAAVEDQCELLEAVTVFILRKQCVKCEAMWNNVTHILRVFYKCLYCELCCLFCSAPAVSNCLPGRRSHLDVSAISYLLPVCLL